MGLFSNRFNKPGPGVEKDEPRKKGVFRFIELLVRHLGDLVKINLLLQLFLLPSQAFLLAALWALSMQNLAITGLFLLGAVAGGILAGPGIAAAILCVSKMLRDEPSYVGHDFMTTFRENFKLAAIYGCAMIFVLLLAAIAIWFYSGISGILGFVIKAITIIITVIVLMSIPNFFLQLVYLDLDGQAMLKNSFLMSIGFLPRSVGGGILGYGLAFLQFLFFPFALMITVLLGYSVPMLAHLLCLWKPIDDFFHIEDAFRERREKEFEEKKL